jgi:hypothetical protein
MRDFELRTCPIHGRKSFFKTFVDPRQRRPLRGYTLEHPIMMTPGTGNNALSQCTGMGEGRGQCLSPHAAPAFSDDDVTPVREVSHRGSHSGGGETPLRAFSL